MTFFVPGRPAPAGSKKGFPIRRKGGKMGVAIVDATGERQKVWQADVRKFAAHFWKDDLITGPVYLNLNFHLRRPKSHYGTGRNANNLKPSAPLYHTQTPDVLKLARAIEDALSGIIYVDDAQIVNEPLSKDWIHRSEREGVLIQIHEITV